MVSVVASLYTVGHIAILHHMSMWWDQLNIRRILLYCSTSCTWSRVQEGDYDHNTDEVIPSDKTYPMNTPGGVKKIEFELRNRQVWDTA